MEQPPSSEDIQMQLQNNSINNILQHISDNPDEITDMVEEAMNSLTPEMKECARKFATSSQANEVRKELQKKGVNPSVVRKQLKQRKKEKKAIPASLIMKRTQKAILITESRKVKPITLSCDNLELAISEVLHVSAPIELSCSRLAQGPLAGKSVKVWYDADNKTKNKLTSKILGYSVGGCMVIIVKDEDLLLDDFMSAKNALI